MSVLSGTTLPGHKNIGILWPTGIQSYAACFVPPPTKPSVATLIQTAGVDLLLCAELIWNLN